MRISDWSSDVCSSDLSDTDAASAAVVDASLCPGARRDSRGCAARPLCTRSRGHAQAARRRFHQARQDDHRAGHLPDRRDGHRLDRRDESTRPRRRQDLRSEEHTSELQSLMRNSSAVFCLKKKKTKTHEKKQKFIQRIEKEIAIKHTPYKA